jgi:hypothetical protein
MVQKKGPFYAHAPFFDILCDLDKSQISSIPRSYGAGQRVTNLKIYAILNSCKRRAPFGPPGLHDSNSGN